MVSPYTRPQFLVKFASSAYIYRVRHMIWLFKKLFGSRNDRVVRRLNKTVKKINQLEPELQKLSDADLKHKTEEFRSRLDKGETLDDILVEAFAVVREVSVRTLGLRHFDVQMIGGMVLHQNKIAEMRTGEGKTLVATLPAYLNAITGKGVHVITVNDYLAQRDSAWMEPIFEFLGLTTGVVVHGMSHVDKQEAYRADITYGTNNEFGFDYLRDNMAHEMGDKVQRPLHYAIVDEVDSILIDEARTPLIISGPAEDSSELYIKIDKLIPLLKKRKREDGPGDYYLDEKARQAFLTEEGHAHIEKLLIKHNLLEEGESLYAASNIALMHHVTAGLRAHTLYNIDVDYMILEGEVVIVDEHTGRPMPGRRWSEGLHQAVEAKEGVHIQSENQTLASITFQNYFRIYDKLAGMTGTADTEAYEFQQIYGLEVVVIPTNMPMIRKDHTDLVFLHSHEKFAAIVEDIKDCVSRSQPVLVGTASIETSENVSKLLDKAGIKHQVLNAKFHEKEAHIIAQAGVPGTVTIATNMAGRGTDIVLGGNLEARLKALGDDSSETTKDSVRSDWQAAHEKVVAAGGLHIIGTERNESRRVDNQLRGRAGRQGDPGSSRYYLSLEDNLLRIFASERITGIMQRLGMQEGAALEAPILSRTIENAQRKVEGRNFDIRKQLLEFDDVANEQRKVIYEQRDQLLQQDDVYETIEYIRNDDVNNVISQFIPPESLDELWDIPALEHQLEGVYGCKLDIQGWLSREDDLHEENLRERIVQHIVDAYQTKVDMVSAEVMRRFEKSVMLQTLDNHWKEHLAAMEYLRQGIHLRGYAQKNPKQEYKREAFELFSRMLDEFKHDVISILSLVQIEQEDVAEAEQRFRHQIQDNVLEFQHASAGSALDEPVQGAGEYQSEDAPKVTTYIREGKKVGRNEPCPCGSGKKYKQCHGRL